MFNQTNFNQNMLPENSLSTTLNATTIGLGTETIVFAHGYGTDQSIWDKITPFFAENYRVVLFDWPFSGSVKDKSHYDPLKYSSYEPFADDLITLLAEMDLEEGVTFVGHSMSGMIGCLASIKKPKLFKTLILLAASPRYINADDYEGGFTTSDVEQLLMNMESNYEEWVSAFSSQAVDPKDEHSVSKFQQCLNGMGAEVAVSLAKTVFYSDYRAILEKVETPCTIIQVSNDIVVPNSAALYMEKNIAGKVTSKVINAFGHFPQLTDHHQLVEVLTDVLGL